MGREPLYVEMIFVDDFVRLGKCLVLSNAEGDAAIVIPLPVLGMALGTLGALLGNEGRT